MLRIDVASRHRAARACSFCGVATAVACTVIALLPTGAQAAGSLALVTCGGSTANAGWSAFAVNVPSSGSTVSTCTQSWTVGVDEPSGYPPGMEAHLPSETTADARAGVQFTAPAGESIAGGDITLAPVGPEDPGYDETGTYAVSQLATGSLENVVWSNVNGGPRTVAIPVGGNELFASVLCGGAPGQSCFYEYLYVIAAHILLSPSATPSVSALTGSLTTGGSQHGTQDVSFTAADPGGPGIYQVTATIDGKVAYQATPNLNGGACAPVGSYGADLEFYSANPCPQSVPVSLPIETGTLPDGIHSLMVTTTDAAGNVSSASQVIFRTENLISTASAGRIGRTGTAGESAYLVHFDGLTNSLLHGVRRSYADSALTLSGTLTTPQDAVAPDVPVHLFARAGSSSTTETMLASTTSDAAGHWSLTAPRGPSRTLRLGYGRASVANTPADTAVKESVSPTMRLRIRDKTGGHLSFTGRVSVTPLARPYPIVVIEASADGRHWQIVGHQVRTSHDGIFHLSYSSAFSVGGRFAFRTSTPETSLWLRGSTKTRWLRVR
jgi:hypothetical protein